MSKPCKKAHIAVLASASLVQPMSAFAAGSEGVTLQHMVYEESDHRMQVDYTQLQVNKDFGTDFSLTAGASVDTMTGATPAVDAKSGPSELIQGENGLIGDGFATADSYTSHLIQMEDERTSFNTALTWRTPTERNEWTAGISYSSEEDYESRGFSVEHLHYLHGSRNRSLTVGYSRLNNEALFYRDRSWRDAQFNTVEVGITEILSPQMLVKASVFAMYEEGALSNPYKRIVRKVNVGDDVNPVFKFYLSPDSRPDERKVAGVDLKGVRRLSMGGTQITWHGLYRLYRDSWGVTSHTLEGKAYIGEKQNVWGQWFAVVRYMDQSEANFYKRPEQVFDVAGFGSVDERLSDFDDTTVGFGVERSVNKHWSFNLRHNQQHQSTGLDLQWTWLGMNYDF